MVYVQNIEVSWTNLKALKVGSLNTNPMYYLETDLWYTPFLVAVNMNTEADAEVVYFEYIPRDPSQRGPNAALAAGVKDSAIIQDITYTANVYGSSGITIQYVNDAVAPGQEYVTVLGDEISVHIVSGVSTAQQVLSAVVGWSAYNGLPSNQSASSAYKVSAVVSGSNLNPQVTQAFTPLTGGIAALTQLADFETNYLGTATKVASFADGIADQVA